MYPSLAGNIPDYSVVFPCIQKLSDKEKRSANGTEVYMIQGLPIPDMMVKLKHNTKLFPPEYVFNTCHLSVCE